MARVRGEEEAAEAPGLSFAWTLDLKEANGPHSTVMTAVSTVEVGLFSKYKFQGFSELGSPFRRPRFLPLCSWVCEDARGRFEV